MRVERQVLFWLSAALALILLVSLLRGVLFPFVAGVAAAYFLNPMVDRLASLRLPRWLAAASIILAVGSIAVVLIVLLAPVLFEQGRQVAEALPGQLRQLESTIEAWARAQFGSRFPEIEAEFVRATRSISENWTSLAAWMAASLWNQSAAVFYFLSFVLVSPLVAFYLLVDWPAMLAKVDGWLPRDHAPTIRRLAGEIHESVAAFIRGQGAVCLILGAFYAVALSAAGLRYGLLVGLATGLMSFIPFVGWALGLMTATALAVAQFWPDTAPIALVVGVFLAGLALDSAFLSPKVVGSRVGLHPVWLIFALFVFTYLLGVVGVLIAVPLAAAIGVLARFALRIYLSSKVYQGRHGAPEPALARGGPPP